MSHIPVQNVPVREAVATGKGVPDEMLDFVTSPYTGTGFVVGLITGVGLYYAYKKLNPDTCDCGKDLPSVVAHMPSDVAASMQKELDELKKEF